MIKNELVKSPNEQDNYPQAITCLMINKGLDRCAETFIA